MTNDIDKYPVSRETLQDLKTYEASLHEWQNKFNLVSKNSLNDSWGRHFLDSMQLYSLVPEGAKTLIDLGSGAGFPGMVLAIMAKGRTPSLKICLVESISKKTLYLKHVSEITNTNVEVINERIEKLKPRTVDVVTSRALASLSELLGLAKSFCAPKTKCIFPKGKSYQSEIDEVKKLWSFDCDIIPNQESQEGVILIITNLRRK